MFDLLVGADAWNVSGLDLIDDFLNLVWVAVCSVELLGVTESDVLKTVDLTEGPEDGVGVLSDTANLEDFAEVGLLRDTLNHVIQKLGLGERILVVYGQVIENFFLCRASFGVLK